MPVPPSRPTSIRCMTESTHSSHPRHHFFATVRIVTGAPVVPRAEYRAHARAGLTLILPDRAPPCRLRTRAQQIVSWIGAFVARHELRAPGRHRS